MNRWLAVIAVGWALAAVALFWAGLWVGQTNRYDDCKLAELGKAVFWACPAHVRPIPQQREPGGAQA